TLPVVHCVVFRQVYICSLEYSTFVAYLLLTSLFVLVVAVRVACIGFLSPRLSWRDQVYSVLSRLSDWVAASLSGQIKQDDLLISLAVASFLFAWTYACYLVAFRLRLAWLASGLLGAALLANVMFKPLTGGGWLVLWC